MIVSSFQSQYGIRLYSQTFKEMKWDEFSALLKGISPDTPLGKIVEIRSENNKDTLKYFTKQQHKLRNEWRSKNIRKIEMDKKTFDEAMKAWENVFVSMAKR